MYPLRIMYRTTHSSSRSISSDSNAIRRYNLLVCKRKLTHLAKLAKWLSCAASTYLYDAFDCMLLSCHTQVSEWILTIVCLNVKELLDWSRRPHTRTWKCRTLSVSAIWNLVKSKSHFSVFRWYHLILCHFLQIPTRYQKIFYREVY